MTPLGGGQVTASTLGMREPSPERSGGFPESPCGLGTDQWPSLLAHFSFQRVLMGTLPCRVLALWSFIYFYFFEI